jgi:hypothetical protein
MITEDIAVGIMLTPYNDFDIIVNLNYPKNGVNYMDITESHNNNKKIYKVGINDDNKSQLDIILDRIIPILLKEKTDNNKILFHCMFGVSRSALIAISFISLYDSYIMAKQQRSYINPSYHFINCMTTYTNDNLLQKYLFNIINAIKENNHTLIEMLVVNGYNLPYNALIHACKLGSYNVIKSILKLKPNKNYNNNAINVYVNSCKITIEIVNYIDDYNKKPIDYANNSNNKTILLYFLNR